MSIIGSQNSHQIVRGEVFTDRVEWVSPDSKLSPLWRRDESPDKKNMLQFRGQGDTLSWERNKRENASKVGNNLRYS